MGITLLGIVLLPLGLVWATNPVRLLQLAFVSAIFEAGAAFLFGSFGLQPALVPGLIFVTYVCAQYALGMRYSGEGQVLRTMTPLIGLLVYAVLSILFLPQAFQGRIMVWPQRPDLLDPGYVPLSFTSGNVTQTLYLALYAMVAICAALLVTRPGFRHLSLLRAYLLGGYLVIGITFWDFAYRVAHVPFPAALVYSNPNWAIVDQSLGPVPRIQATFSEPAALAFYLSGLFFCCLWLNAKGRRIMRVDILLILSIFAMLLSTSTTGLLTLVAGFPMMIAFAALSGNTAAIGRLLKKGSMLAIAGIVIVGPLLILVPSLQNAVNEVVTSTLSKGDSESYEERSGLDGAAIGTLTQTDGLGVGWGSFRASSLIPGLSANGGIFGLLMVLALAWQVTGLMRRAGRQNHEHPGNAVLDGFGAALCGQLAAALVSAPTISDIAFYLQLGCVTGTAARMLQESRSVKNFTIKQSNSAILAESRNKGGSFA
ncbi:hypothetical protein ACELLULO517_15990 [Acidisoma cellulosilytica]|uniref:O-antigen ligase domain-containing protein n=1 Tax=Acidisoma cellulosilyticum TaxID=2802395 RepID=A0A963Z493_9PROT|nr:hypothetical protein [Acidisoma cellulosilyticum]MCB8881750.1 hypothetical protein [Acidisoma cellulosilyticum]